MAVRPAFVLVAAVVSALLTPAGATPAADCTGGRLIPDSDRDTPATACAGPPGTECLYRCRDGSVAFALAARPGLTRPIQVHPRRGPRVPDLPCWRPSVHQRGAFSKPPLRPIPRWSSLDVLASGLAGSPFSVAVVCHSAPRRRPVHKASYHCA